MYGYLAGLALAAGVWAHLGGKDFLVKKWRQIRAAYDMVNGIELDSKVKLQQIKDTPFAFLAFTQDGKEINLFLNHSSELSRRSIGYRLYAQLELDSFLFVQKRKTIKNHVLDITPPPGIPFPEISPNDIAATEIVILDSRGEEIAKFVGDQKVIFPPAAVRRGPRV